MRVTGRYFGTVGRSRPFFRLLLFKKAVRAAWKMARKVLLSGVLLGFLALCLLGYLVGRDEVPHPVPVPIQQMFDNLQVYSYKDTPSDTSFTSSSSRHSANLRRVRRRSARFLTRVSGPPLTGRSAARTTRA
jgi:hypothetical protein